MALFKKHTWFGKLERKIWPNPKQGLKNILGVAGIVTGGIELKKIGVRKTPVFSNIERSHPLNRTAGKLLTMVGLH